MDESKVYTTMNDYKFCFAGDMNVGKTCIVYDGAFPDEGFSETNVGTAGMALFRKKIGTGTLLLFDTSGEDENWYYHCENRTEEEKIDKMKFYYNRACFACIVYDITNRESFVNAENFWLKQVKTFCPLDVEIYLFGNKVDLEDKRTVSTEEGKALADKYGLIFFEGSAKSQTNTRELYKDANQRMIDYLGEQ